MIAMVPNKIMRRKIGMDKMRMESPDITAQNIDRIAALFPSCVTESVDENGKPKKAINFELLKQMLCRMWWKVMSGMNSPGR